MFPSRASGALCLPTPDWLAHCLVVIGPAEDVAAFRTAIAGPGLIPWHLGAPELQEGWFNQLVAPPLERRGITVEDAHVLAGQLVASVQALQAETVAGAPGRDCVVPLDLHALVPVPADLLALGPEAPEAEAWLWEHWGTIWPLRGLAEETCLRSHAAPPVHRAGRGSLPLPLGRLVALACVAARAHPVAGAALPSAVGVRAGRARRGCPGSAARRRRVGALCPPIPRRRAPGPALPGAAQGSNAPEAVLLHLDGFEGPLDLARRQAVIWPASLSLTSPTSISRRLRI